VLANTALDRCEILPAPLRLARDIIFSTGCVGNQWRRHQRHQKRHEWRQGFRHWPEQAIEGADRYDGGDRHRADADRIDVVEMCAFEFHMPRA
jgi:hypothetical protein